MADPSAGLMYSPSRLLRRETNAMRVPSGDRLDSHSRETRRTSAAAIRCCVSRGSAVTTPRRRGDAARRVFRRVTSRRRIATRRAACWRRLTAFSIEPEQRPRLLSACRGAVPVAPVDRPSTPVRRSRFLWSVAVRRIVPQVSPDGKWLAYQSNETGRPEIYVKPFPDGPASGRCRLMADSSPVASRRQ
jgi:hypothetical protein